MCDTREKGREGGREGGRENGEENVFVIHEVAVQIYKCEFVLRESLK